LTRLGLISDVHANLPALQAVLLCFEQSQVDIILCAGDQIAGPYPNESIELLRRHNVVTIRGNTDTSFIDLCRGRAPVEQYKTRQYALIRWSAEKVNSGTLAWLECLPEECVFSTPENQNVHIAHGSPGNPSGGLDPQKDGMAVERAAMESRGSLLVVGHSHRQWFRQYQSAVICNPGAVCGPLDGTLAAQYALADWAHGRWKITLQSAEYDLTDLRRGFSESGLLDAGGPLARAYLSSLETGRDVVREFLEFANSLAGPGHRFIPDKILDQAAVAFPWPEQLTPGL
jgi:putative phosphoesterase